MGAFRFILALAGVLLLVTFGVKNMHLATVGFYGLPSRTVPLFYLLLMAFALGAVSAWVFHIVEKVRLRWKSRRDQADLRKLRDRVQEMEERSLVPVLAEGEDIEPAHSSEVGPVRAPSADH